MISLSRWPGPPCMKAQEQKSLLAKVADATLPGESTEFDREGQEEWDTLQLSESIPYECIHYFNKAIKRSRKRKICRRQKFVGLGWRHAEHMGQRSVERRRQIRGPWDRDVEEPKLSEEDHRLASRCRLRDVVVRVRTLRSLASLGSHWGVVSKKKSIYGEEADWWCADCGGQCDWKEANIQGTDPPAGCRPEDTWVFKAQALPPGACDNMMVAMMSLANLQEKASAIEVVCEGIRWSN